MTRPRTYGAGRSPALRSAHGAAVLAVATAVLAPGAARAQDGAGGAPSDPPRERIEIRAVVRDGGQEGAVHESTDPVVTEDPRALPGPQVRPPWVDVFAIEPFDAEAWQRRLTADDLDLRARAYERLLERLPRWAEARAWVEALAEVPRGELAWTCRLLLRDLARRPAPAPGDFDRSTGVERGVVEHGVIDHGDVASRVGTRGFGVFVVGEDAQGGVRSLVLELDPQLVRGAPLRLGDLGLGLRGATPSVGDRAGDLVPAPPSVVHLDLVFADFVEDGATPPERGEGTAILQGFGRMLVPGLAPELQRSGELVRLLPTDGILPESGAEARAPRPQRGGGTFVLRRERDVRSTDVPLDRLGVLVSPSDSGLFVHDVVPGSLAQVLGIGAGDRLLAIDDRELDDPEQISRFLERARRTGRITVRWSHGPSGASVERRYVRVEAPAEPAGSGSTDAMPAPPGADGAVREETVRDGPVGEGKAGEGTAGDGRR